MLYLLLVLVLVLVLALPLPRRRWCARPTRSAGSTRSITLQTPLTPFGQPSCTLGSDGLEPLPQRSGIPRLFGGPIPTSCGSCTYTGRSTSGLRMVAAVVFGLHIRIDLTTGGHPSRQIAPTRFTPTGLIIYQCGFRANAAHVARQTVMADRGHPVWSP